MADHHRRADKELVQQILIDDAQFLRRIVEKALQQLLEAEITEHVGAAPYERTQNRKGHRNGYKPRKLKSRVGTLELLVPQDREGDGYAQGTSSPNWEVQRPQARPARHQPGPSRVWLFP